MAKSYDTKDETFSLSAGKLTESGRVFRLCYLVERQGWNFDRDEAKPFWLAEGWEKDEFSPTGESQFSLTLGSKKLHRVLSKVLAENNPEKDGKGVWIKICGYGSGFDRGYTVEVVKNPIQQKL